MCPRVFLQDRIPQRTVLRDPQLAEQLVEVPTVVSPSFFQQQFADQNVDTPVPVLVVCWMVEAFKETSPGQCPMTAQAQAPVVEYISTAPAVFQAPVPLVEYISLRLLCVKSLGGAQLHVRDGFLPGQHSTAFPRAQHHVHAGFLPGQRFSTFRGAELHDHDGRQDRVRHRSVELALSPDRVQQRLEEQIFAPGVSVSGFWKASGADGGCACGDGCTFAHSCAELHPEASANERPPGPPRPRTAGRLYSIHGPFLGEGDV